MPNYLPNGHTIVAGTALDETLSKIMARQGDGTYKWVHGANNPSTAVESLVWDAAGAITVPTLAVTSLTAASLTATGPLLLPDGTVGAPALAFTSEPTLGLYRVSAQVLGVAGQLQLTSIGPHSIGAVASTGFQLSLHGTWAPGPFLGAALFVNTQLQLSSGQTAYGIELAPSFIRSSSGGTHGFIASMVIAAPVSASGTDTATQVATLRISGAPTFGTNRYALQIAGGDVQWGAALVALGGGAAPTFGTIGGSGPATAGQNSWMRVVDSTGAAFWAPVWK